MWSDQANVSVYQLTFDYTNKLVDIQKKFDLLDANMVENQFPSYKISMVNYIEKYLYICAQESSKTKDVVVMYYNVDTLFYKKHPDFIYKGPFESIDWLWSILINDRLYFFKSSKIDEFSVKSFIELSDKIYYHDFGTNSIKEIQLVNSISKIKIDKFHINRVKSIGFDFKTIYLG